MSNIVLKEPITPHVRKKLAAFSDLEAHLLFHRGIESEDQAREFLSPQYDTHSHPAEKLKDIDRAVTRVLEAISKNEKICIYSDYDADGIPGAVILSDCFEKIGYTNF